MRSGQVILTSAHAVLSSLQSALRKMNTMRRMQKRWLISSLVTTKVGIATIKATLGSLDSLQRVQSLLNAEEEETRTRLSSKIILMARHVTCGLKKEELLALMTQMDAQ